jgi:hypothetical protein
VDVEKGLLAEMIPGRKKFAPIFVPDGECEHSPQPIQATLSGLFVQMQNDLVSLRANWCPGFPSSAVPGNCRLTVADDPDRLSSLGIGWRPSR